MKLEAYINDYESINKETVNLEFDKKLTIFGDDYEVYRESSPLGNTKKLDIGGENNECTICNK